MKIAPRITSFAPTQPLEYKLEAVKVRPAVGVKLEDYLKENPSPILFAGPLSRAAANAGFKPGAPLTLGPNFKFRPFVALSGAAAAPTPGPAAKSPTTPSSIAKAAQVVSLLDACRGPFDELAKTHPGLDAPLDFLGVVVASPQVWNAMIKPGPKDKVEVFLAVSQAGVWIAFLDCSMRSLSSCGPE
jgi:hypothetical protein